MVSRQQVAQRGVAEAESHEFLMKETIKQLLSRSPVMYRQARGMYRGWKAATTRFHRDRNANPHPADPTPAAPPEPQECTSAPIPGVTVVTTLDELDNYLRLCDEAAARSDDDLRKVLASFEFRREQTSAMDPYSDEYARQQHELYLHISGVQSYSPQNERSHWLKDLADAARQPFPYYTHSAQTVGDHLMALGFIIRTLNLPSGASILEFGAGWGNTSINLARMGYAVTAVDIEPRFLDLINERAAMLGLAIETVCQNFGPVLGSDGTPRVFDAVLFYESFHHCSDHRKLVQQLRSMIKDDGVVAFASEPITDSFPLPWGLRLDGMSAWSIRNFKWLELGYQESYFRELMARNGWTLTKQVCADTHLGIIFLARKAMPTPESRGPLAD